MRRRQVRVRLPDIRGIAGAPYFGPQNGDDCDPEIDFEPIEWTQTVESGQPRNSVLSP